MPRKECQWSDVSGLTSEDVIDSRDVVSAIDHLESILPEREEGDESDDEHADERALLAALVELREDYSGSEGFDDGATLIRESHFREYAEQLADDIGAIDRNATWPLTCIDWDKAADELKADYTTSEVDGTTFYYRA